MIDEPFVSVIIPSLFRHLWLVRVVEDLLLQDFPRYEIIVVEQQEKTPEVEELAARYSDRLTYVFHEGVSFNAPYQKNVGAKRARGNFFLFLDDDSRVPSYFISQLVALFRDPEVGAIAPKILQPRDPLEPGQEGVVGRVSGYGSFVTNYSSDTATTVDTVHGCSMYRREAFEKAGGFDERFIGNAMREESDLSFRVRKSGYVLRFEPSVEFIHVKAPMGGTRAKTDRMEWYFDFFHNDALFFLKNLRWYWMPIFLLSKVRPILACGFYYGKARPRAIFLPFRAYFAAYKDFKNRAK